MLPRRPPAGVCRSLTNTPRSLEDLGIDGFDIVSADGVVNLRLGSHGTYVLNKQTPTRQVPSLSRVIEP